jgi:CheY-like chemotaxis protein
VFSRSERTDEARTELEGAAQASTVPGTVALSVAGKDRYNRELRRVMAKILLVEDNELNRDMLSRRLVRRGFEVVVAVDGRQGVDAALRELPDLVLMDMSLPVLDGWAATRELKANPVTSAIPVLALTAHAMDGARTSALEAGCDDYDSKPVELERLLGKIERLLSLPGCTPGCTPG